MEKRSDGELIPLPSWENGLTRASDCIDQLMPCCDQRVTSLSPNLLDCLLDYKLASLLRLLLRRHMQQHSLNFWWRSTPNDHPLSDDRIRLMTVESWWLPGLTQKKRKKNCTPTFASNGSGKPFSSKNVKEGGMMGSFHSTRFDAPLRR